MIAHPAEALPMANAGLMYSLYKPGVGASADEGGMAASLKRILIGLPRRHAIDFVWHLGSPPC